MVKPTHKASGKLFEEPETPSARAEGAYTANIDGAARGNPGPAAYGVVVRRPDGTTHESLGKYIGRATNNVAEYYAPTAALDSTSDVKPAYGSAPEKVTSPAKGALYLEDLHVGQKFTSGKYRMDENRIKAFAAEFDPQPFYLDDATARHSVFRGLAASGWHTAAATMRLLVTSGLPFAGGLVGLGGEIAWVRPTRPGDTLRVESEILAVVPSRTKPNQAVVTVRSITVNQNGEEVQALTTKILAFKRKGDPTTPN